VGLGEAARWVVILNDILWVQIESAELNMLITASSDCHLARSSSHSYNIGSICTGFPVY